MVLLFPALIGIAFGELSAPVGYDPEEYTFNFRETETERENNWQLSGRCGQRAVAGSPLDQRNDVKCPNVILINTDDMAWSDVSINNPSKLVPTPNIDKLVSKGVNFRDGHSCTSRCAPSRYCLMTGRYHFRRGDYHYQPISLEPGRKIMPQLFKRNNYHTMVVGKAQPVESKLDSENNYFLDGTRFWGFDKAFNSKSYCCRPGGGYFENDHALAPFNRWGIFTNFREGDEKMNWVQDMDLEREFFNDPENWHFLDGYYVDGNERNGRIRSSYKAYWSAVKHSNNSGDRRRRRRAQDGKLTVRDSRANKLKPSGVKISEGMKPHELGKNNYLRFRNIKTGKVLIAGYEVPEEAKETVKVRNKRSFYEFAKGRRTFRSEARAEAYKQEVLAEMVANGISVNSRLYTSVRDEPAKPTQEGFDSSETMYMFHKKAREFIEESVSTKNPITREGEMKDSNRPFFMYLAFRAPHRPSSHNLTFDENNPLEFYPHISMGKPGEQLLQFDELIGNIMKTVTDMEIADNTLVIFTSDNGPDIMALNYPARYGHHRMSTMRGKKSSIYEAGHRVPFLSWWPKGIHQSLWGTNYDLPVGQTDLFATFADIMGYPLPAGDKCTYAYDENTASADKMRRLGRPKRLSRQESDSEYERRIRDNTIDGYYNGPDSGYTAEVSYRGRMAYAEEKAGVGYSNTETWLTIEDNTGFLVGWDGCMAEDSVSFAGAFQADHFKTTINRRGNEVHHFKSKQQAVPAKIFASKLGDLAIRFGRYKFVRFNAPKDLRTGENKQHEAGHEGAEWIAAEGTAAQCRYNEDGSKINPDCTVEKQCRTHTTWGQTFCVRDHYYQLWDLEKNFGEKRYCDNEEYESAQRSFRESIKRLGITRSTYRRGFDKNSTSLFERFGSESDSTRATNKPPKGTDIYGIGTGKESSPIGFLSSDCCKTIGDNNEDRRRRRNAEEELGNNGLPRYNCATARISIEGVESDGGDCKMLDVYTPGGTTNGLQDGSWRGQREWFTEIENKFLYSDRLNYAELYGWTPEVYFNWPSRGQWTPGYGCSKMRTGKEEGSNKVTSRKIWDESIGEWRIITHADRLCYRQDTATDPAPETPGESTGETTGTNSCAVPDHAGPLAEGQVQHKNLFFFNDNCFEGNSKYQADTPSRHKPGVNDGDIDPADFGKWFDFANCLKSALEIIEGQAHFPEAKNLKTVYGTASVVWDEQPYEDDGSLGGNKMTDDFVLAGLEIGASKTSKIRQKNLWRIVNNSQTGFEQFHGAGTRFVEKRFIESGADSILSKCARFLPDGEETAYEIKPDFDAEQTLMGFYEMNDNEKEINQKSNHRLIVEDDGTYRDPRTIMKYYKKPYTLNGFIPRY